jgi:hypothetical protein
VRRQAVARDGCGAHRGRRPHHCRAVQGLTRQNLATMSLSGPVSPDFPPALITNRCRKGRFSPVRSCLRQRWANWGRVRHRRQCRGRATVSSAGRRSVLIGGVVAMVAIVVVAVLALSGGNPVTTASSTEEATAAVPAGPSAPDPTSAAQQYLHAFAAGDTDTAGVLTDDPHAYFMRELFTIGALAAPRRSYQPSPPLPRHRTRRRWDPSASPTPHPRHWLVSASSAPTPRPAGPSSRPVSGPDGWPPTPVPPSHSDPRRT